MWGETSHTPHVFCSPTQHLCTSAPGARLRVDLFWLRLLAGVEAKDAPPSQKVGGGGAFPTRSLFIASGVSACSCL